MGALDVKLGQLAAQARRSPFFALVKRILRTLPGAPSPGSAERPRDEAIRFAHDVAPIFHSGDVSALRFDEHDGKTTATLTTTFLGLVGAVSPLASFFTDDLLDEELADDRTTRDFYDLFHHRLIALLYRALLRGDPAAEVRLDGRDQTTTRSLAMSGLAPPDGSPLSARQWLGVARVLGRRPRTRAALEAALLLALPHLQFRITDFLASGVRGRRARGPRFGDPIVLRRGSSLERGRGPQAQRVRLVIGPVGARGLPALLPGGSELAKLRAVVRATLGGRFDAELEIEIAVGEEPHARMGARYGARLGRNTLALRAGRPRNVRVRLPLMDDAADERAVFLVSRSSS